MTASRVQWVLIIYYGVSVHKATYGRFKNPSYSKDYIQLSKTDEFLADLPFSFSDSIDGKRPLIFKWPNGSAPGTLFRRSADRPHLTWETKSKGAPLAWRMALNLSDETEQTIPGDPDRHDADGADEEFAKLGERGAGQPYLIAVKLDGEPDTLHLRAYLDKPSSDLVWASSQLLPLQVRELLNKASATNNLAWRRFDTSMGGEPLLFDPDKNHDAWDLVGASSSHAAVSAKLVEFDPTSFDSDSAAEALPISEVATDAFRAQIEDGNFEVDDQVSSVKTRGSAQRAFSDRVKKNYGWRCAVTGISTKSMLVGAHIVPWSKDKTTRLDPANGICLSVLFDKAFELGLILISDDLTVTVNWDKLGSDDKLGEAMKAYDGKKMRAPAADPPRTDFLKRRRDLFTAPS